MIEDKKGLRIIFLGTPEFAVGVLDSLVSAGYNIVGVVTAPDRLGGRGMKQIIESAVKKRAKSLDLPILQPTNLKKPEFIEALQSYKADLQIVVAFRMLPIVVWDMPKLGTYNLHGSLLPKYRGAAPINWAIMKGEAVTGVTTFKLKHEIDTGSIALQERVQINPGDYLNTVHDNMMSTGAQLMVKTVDAICAGSITLKEQDDTEVTKAPKIFHKDCRISFHDNVRSIYNKIRGLSPYPVAWTTINKKKVKIYRATYTYDINDFEVGTIISDGKSYMAIACTGGLIFLTEVKEEGKRKMKIRDYLNGLNLKKNKQLSQAQILPLWSW